jgi:hypothetical protein
MGRIHVSPSGPSKRAGSFHGEINPYLAGSIFVGSLVDGCYPLVPKRTLVLAPDRLLTLTSPLEVGQNPGGAAVQSGAALSAGIPFPAAIEASPGLKEIVSPNE